MVSDYFPLIEIFSSCFMPIHHCNTLSGDNKNHCIRIKCHCNFSGVLNVASALLSTVSAVAIDLIDCWATVLKPQVWHLCRHLGILEPKVTRGWS